MPQQVTVPVVNLLLDEQNARLGQETDSQQQAAIALAKQQGRRLVRLAESVVQNGLDPAQLPSVLSTDDTQRRYKVVEGNRRVLALKALENPSLIQSALDGPSFKKLQALAAKFLDNPIEDIVCVLYAPDEAQVAYSWVSKRHTGAQEGAGLVEWASDEKDRFASRHGSGQRGLAGQVLDFLVAADGATTSPTKISTTLERLLSTPNVRDRLGIDRVGNELISWYPLEEVVKGLRHVVDDLRSERIKVTDVYTAENRRDYIETLKRTVLPKKSQRLKDPVKLDALPSGANTPAPIKSKGGRKSRASKRSRTTVASSTANLNPSPPRINSIYNELLGLSAESYPNAGAVLLRVFLEMSVDDYIDREGAMTQPEKTSAVLAKRIKAVAAHLDQSGKIDNQLKRAVNKIADGQHTIAASVTTFHQYVHNPYVHPKPSELRTSWDELQPFLEAVWS